VVSPPANEPTETFTLYLELIDCNGPWCATPASISAQVQGCTPTITSIIPSTWFAEKSCDKVVIKGTGFITAAKATAACPVTPVTASTPDGSVITVSNINVKSDKEISVTIKPDVNTTTEQATVTVGTAPNIATSASLATPPQVLGNEIHCDPSLNCTQDPITTTDGTSPPVQNVVVGQPIILTTNPNLPATITPYKTTWSVGGANIGGYAPTLPSTTVSKTGLKQSTLKTFWLYQGQGVPVTYQYCVDIPGVGNQCSLPANATFNVAGPTDTIKPVLSLPQALGSWQVFPTSAACNVQWLYFGLEDTSAPSCPGSLDIPGIFFDATNPTNIPNGGGNFFWVQIIKSAVISGTEPGVTIKPDRQGPGLDNSYPYIPVPDNPLVELDAPATSLDNALTTESESFNATMYLMWISAINPASIPVPIGYVDWSISATAIQKSTNSPPWSLAKQETPTAVFTASSDTGGSYHGLPHWTKLLTNTAGNQSLETQMNEETEPASTDEKEDQ